MSNTIRDFMVTVESGDIAAIVAAYGSLDQGDKARARNSVANAVKVAMQAQDFDKAKGLFDLQDVLKATPKAKAEVDPNKVIAERIAVLNHAANALAGGSVVPDGIDADGLDYEAILALVDADDFDAATIEEAGDKIAGAKITRSGKRGDVAAHIESAMSEVESGAEVLVSAIHNHRNESTGDYAPSSGAIFARFEAWNDKGDLPEYVAAWKKSDKSGKMVAVKA